MKLTSTLTLIAILAMMVIRGGEAVAEESGAGRPSAPKSKRINFEEVTVSGKIVKPQVQFIISREKGTTDEVLVPKESFVPKIIESVQSAPF